MIPLVYILVLITKFCKINYKTQCYILSYVLFALGQVFLFIFPYVRHSMNLYVKNKYNLSGCESYINTCNMNYYVKDTKPSFW